MEDNPVRLFQTSFGKPPCKIWASAIENTGSFTINLCGGTKPHIGAMALSLPYQGSKNKKKLSCTTSLICVPHHKEDGLAFELAEESARFLGKAVALTVGIHIDNASEDEIKKLSSNARKSMRLLIKTLLKKEAWK
ncbi:MAG: hypothetical protein M1536_05970 [Firmicutes bacterium]|nr:hypothetical protein [Bacillota bacterium]